MAGYWRQIGAFFCLVFFFAANNAALAQGAASPSPTPVNLDLTSTDKTLKPGGLLKTGDVTINQGGQSVTVSQSSLLTPAERLAVYQVVSTGQQSILLGALGNAVGGTFTMGPKFGQYVSSLVIPQGVTAVRDFGTAATLNLSGNLTNAGNLYAISSNAAVTNAVINANNIINQQGALLSSVLSSNAALGAAGAVSNLNLSLNALQDIINAGIISSAGSLTATAGGSIINALPAGVTGPSPVMQAINNINLLSGAGNIVNSGLISSLSGNINVASQLASSLAVENMGGTLQALAGQINVRDPSYTANGDVNLFGGDWLSQQLNLYGGSGAANADINQVTGQINISADSAHIKADSPNLNLGNLVLTGDPTYYNTGGSVTISNLNLGFSGDLAVVASQDVVINSAYLVTFGGNMTLIAGANIQPPPASQNSQHGPESTTTLTINGGSATGGSVQVSGGSLLTEGGNLLVAAFSGTGAGSTHTPGSVNISSAIDTSDVSTFYNNGNVTIIAGATTGTGITTDSITTSGSYKLNAGNVTLLAATPVIGGSSLSITNGTVTVNNPTSSPAAAFQTSGLSYTNAGIDIGDVLAAGAGGGPGQSGGNGGTVFVQAGGNISTGYLRTFGGGGSGADQDNGGFRGGDGGNISVVSTGGSVSISGDANSSGGGGGGQNFGTTIGGNGGSITASAATSVTIDGPVLAAGGGFGGTGNSRTCCQAGNGGGSFGGGGGGGAGTLNSDQITGGGGGGGFFGGGGAGARGGEASRGNPRPGGLGGGGGFQGGGGGGGGGSGARDSSTVYGVGGGAGGGGGAGAGGGSGSITSGVSIGGAGGGGGTTGGSGTGNSTAGTGSGGGGNGDSGACCSGNGGNGGGNGSGLGGAVFGIAGTGGSGGGDVGSSGNGGTITLKGTTIEVLQTAYSAFKSMNIFAYLNSPYGGDSINALGPNGKITIQVSGIITYLSDANYGSSASNYIYSLPSFNSSGRLAAGNGSGTPIQIYTTSYSSPVSSGTYVPPHTITEIYSPNTPNQVTNSVSITAGGRVTPAEIVAFSQVALGNPQTIILTQPTSTTSSGTGYASGGNFSIAAGNIPSSNFSQLVLPANVTANASVPVLTYNSSATINGTLNLGGTPGGSLIVDGTVSGTGSIIAAQGTLSITSTGDSISASSLNLSAGAGGNITLSAPAGSISTGNLITAGSGGHNAGNGGSGGQISIQANGLISTGSLITFGGGGGGGGGSHNGGSGGKGGTVWVSSDNGAITISGDINVSGGGGGGGGVGGGTYLGGSGGEAGTVFLTGENESSASSVTVFGNIYAVSGGSGGNTFQSFGGGGGGNGGILGVAGGSATAGAGGGGGSLGGSGGGGNGAGTSGGDGTGGGFSNIQPGSLGLQGAGAAGSANAPGSPAGASTGGSVQIDAAEVIITGSISCPSVSFIGRFGNIASIADGSTALSVNNLGFGVQLSAFSVRTNGRGGITNLHDTFNETVTLGPLTSEAQTSFRLSANGSILSTLSTAITSPSISLTALGGNIGGNTTASSALLINSGGTAGLSLFANATTVISNGGSINLSDANSEAVTLANGTNAGLSFTLGTKGNIRVATAAQTAITSPIVSLTALGGNIGGNALAGTPLLLTSGGAASGLNLFANATTNSGSGGVINLSDSLAEVVTLASGTSGKAITLNSGGTIIVAGTVQATAGSVIFTTPLTVPITSVYPVNLDLSITNPTLTIPYAGGVTLVTVNNGGLVTTTGTGTTIKINGISQTDPLGPGSYQSASYSITISVGTGTLTIGPTTQVTPSEWIAAIQKQNTSSQPLTIGSNNAASSGASFTIASANLPPGGFTNINIPSGVTANVSTTSLQTPTLTNNGIIQASGGQTDLLITSASTTSGNLEIAGTGSFITTPTGTGTLTLQTAANLLHSLTIDNGTNLSITGALTMISGNIVVGSSGSATATLRTNNGSGGAGGMITIEPRSTGIGALNIAAGGSAATLRLNDETGGALVSTLSTLDTDIGSNFVLIAQNVSMSDSVSGSLTSSGTLTVSQISLSAQGGSVGQSSSYFPIFAIDSSQPLKVTAQAGRSVYLKDTQTSDTVSFLNTSKAGTSFNVNVVNNITSSSTAVIQSPSITLISSAGSIGSSNTPISVNSGGTSGLSLLANAASGSIFVSDANAESVTLGNASGALASGSSFVLSANGNILASNAASTAIISSTISLTALGGNIGGNATASSPLLINSGGISGLNIFAKATKVSTVGGTISLSDTNGEIVTVATGTSGSAITLASTSSIVVGGTMQASGAITFFTSTSGQITSVYPANLDLSAISPSLLAPSLSAAFITVNSGGSVTTSGSTISLNGQTIGSTLNPGSYGTVTYSIVIAGGPTGTLTVTPTTQVTPAEWVAAIQKQNTGSQILTIGTNNAASGGNFTIASANVPAGGFSNINIPSSVTANVSVASLQTPVLTNNGILQSSGGQTNLLITSVGATGGNLAIAGSGSFVTSSGTVTFQTATGSSNNLTIGSATNLSVTGALTMISPNIVVGSSGSATAILTTNNGSGGAGGAITVKPSSTGTGTLTFSTGGSAATLQLNGAVVTTQSSTGTSLGSNFSLAAGTAITLSDTAGGNITGSGSISSPITSISETGGNIGGNSTATTPLLVNNGGAGLSLSVSATNIGSAGGTVNLSDTSSETVTLNNSSQALSASTSFVLNTSGNIAANTAANNAIASPSISLTASAGNIASNTLANSALLINSGGTSGLQVFGSASNGSVNLQDANAESVTLANGASTVLGASGSFTLNTKGNILASTPGSTGIASPSISLTALGGNIGGNASATSTLLVNSSGTSGLNLFANATNVSGAGGAIKLSDNTFEVLTVATGTTGSVISLASASTITVAGTIQATGNISFTTTTTGQITSVYPTGLDLSVTSPTLIIPGASANFLTVNSGGSVNSSGGSISLNGTTQTNPLTSGSYGTASSFSIPISVGTGTLNVTGTTQVTPAEWVAAIQVQNTSSQPLTIGSNNAASAGGSFTIASANLPSDGFSTINIPASVTANVSVSSLQTTAVINNGIMQASGTQSNLLITSVGTTGGNLVVGGTGQFITSSGTVTLQSDNNFNAIVFNDATTLSVVGALTMITPAIYVGTSGFAAATLTTTNGSGGAGGTITAEHNSAGTNTFSFNAGGTSALLQLNGGPVSVLSSDTTGILGNFMLKAGTSIAFNNTGGNITGPGSLVSPIISLTATGGNIASNAAGTIPLSVNSGGTSGLNLFAKATQVSGTGGTINLSDTNNEVLTVATGTSGSVITLTSAATITVAGTVTASGNITFTTSTNGQIASIYPTNLDLSVQVPTLTIPAAAASFLTVNSGGSVTSSGGTISLNSNTQSNPLAPGSYETANYSVTIAIGTSGGTLNITPSVQVTPAEWVAAIQQQNTSSQPLTIGTNNAASSGAVFTIASANLPSGGFTNINIPTGVTANVSTSSLQTPALTNNGIIQTSGGQTNLSITSVGTTSGNLQLAGSGSFSASSGTVTIQTATGVGNTLTMSGGANLAITGALTIISPNIVVGTSGTVTATLTTNNGSGGAGGAITVQPSSAGTGTLAFTAGGSGATLNLNGAAVSTSSSTGTSISSNFKLSAGTSIAISDTGGGNISGAGTISSPIISLTEVGGNIGGNASASTSLSVNNGTGLSLYASAARVSGSGGTVNLSDTTSEAVTLGNDTSALNAGVSFTLNTSGSILANTPANTAITSPNISLTASSGNIGGNSSASSALLVNSGGTSGLTIFAKGISGKVNLSDVNGEAVTLANGASNALSAVGSFTLSASGNILASTPGSTAITSSSISLTALGGNIGGNSTASSALLINSGGTSGLNLFANATNVSSSGGTINLRDANNEVVTVATGTSGSTITLASGNTFTVAGTLQASGNINFIAALHGQITSNYAAGLDLSATSPTLTLPAVAGSDSVTVNGGASATSGGTISLDGQSLGSSLTPDSYGGSLYSVTIAVGTGTLTITPTVQVTPAEWVAAVQVQSTSSQPLTIGSNNAASGGSFTITSGNLPSGGLGFTNINIPSNVTANVSAASLQTPSLTNNGIIQASGAQTSVSVTSVGTASGNLVLAGSGQYLAPTGAVTFQTATGGSNTLTLSTSTNVSVTGALTLISHNIVTGTSGTATAILSTGGGAVTVKASSAGTGFLTFTTAGSAASLQLNGGAVTTSSSTGTSIGSNVTLSAGTSIALSDTAGGNITGAGSIASPIISLTETGGNIGGNVAASIPLLVSSGGTSGLNLFANATQVSGTGGTINLSDANNEVVTVATGTAGSVISLASKATITVPGTVQATGNITFSTSTNGQIASLFPSNLDLSATSPLLTIPGGAASFLTVTSGGSVTSTGGTITLNTLSQTNPLNPGSYGTATSYSVSIATAIGTLIITPTTRVTPAAWVAAIQVQNTSSQPLTIGGNNAASGGIFTIAASNVPSGGFSNINIPTNVTANVSGASLQTPTLTNNGIIQASGNQTNVSITSVGTASGNLVIAGTGQFITSSGTVMMQTATGSSNTLTINNATNLSITGALTMISPTIVVGASGTSAATLTTNDGSGGSGGAILIMPSSAGTGALAFNSGGSAATLQLNGAAATTTSSTGTTIGSNFTLGAGTSIAMSDTGSGNITTASGGSIASPIISLTAVNGNIGGTSTAGSPISIGSGGTSGLVLFARTTTGTINLSDTRSEAVTLSNSTSALSASVSFSLSTQGNILANTAANAAIASPTISLTVAGGNVGGDSAATSPLVVSSGGTSGLNLFAIAATLTDTGGAINLADGNNEVVTLSNGTTALSAGKSFTLGSNGNILASVSGNTAITSPTISLTALGGNVAGNALGSTALLVTSGGTSGLSLFANATNVSGSGGTVNLTDSNQEAVTLGNATSALNAAASFTFLSNSSILANTAGNTAITAPILTLTALGGNIAGDAAGSSALLVNSGGSSGLSLLANATTVKSVGGTINLSDANSEAVTLANSAAALNAGVSFTLAANGNILASTPASTAITTFAVFLTAVGGNIGGNAAASSPLLVNSGTASTGLSIFASASMVSSAGATINLSDTDKEVVTLQNGTTGNVFTLNSGASITVNGTMQASGNISFTTSATGQITDVFPAELDLTATTPGLLAPAVAASFLTVTGGGSVTSSSGTISLNGSNQGSALSSGDYGSLSYSVVISGGPSGTVIVTPNTSITPAEWVAAIQVQNTNSQPLTISTNNAASNGSFSIDTINQPSSGFTNINIPSPITANVSIASLQTNNLTNNGYIQPSGGQTNVSITAAGTSSGNMTIAGTGQFNAPSGTVIIQTATTATNSLTINALTNLSIIGALTLISPNIVVGSSGAATAFLTTSSGSGGPGGAITVKPSSAGTGALAFSAGGSSATLQLNNGAVSTTSTTGTSIGSNFTLAAELSIAMNDTGTGNIITGSLGSIISPILSVTAQGGNVGTSAGAPLSFASSTSTAGLVNLVGQAGGSVWLSDSLANDLVQFANSTAVSSAGTAFSITTQGSIIASATTVALQSRVISFSSTGANIGTSTSAPISIASSASTPGTVSLIVQASGLVYLADALTGDAVKFNNDTSGAGAVLTAGLFSLATKGNINSAFTPVALQSGTISLTTTAGNIGTSSTAPLSIATGASTPGTLSLVAQASGSVWLTDTLFGEAVQFNNDPSNSGAASSAGTAFALAAQGTINAALNTTALVSPAITLQASGGNIGTSVSNLLSIASSATTAGTVSLVAQAAGAVWLTDTLASDNVQFANGSAVSNAGTIFNAGFLLVTQGNITAAASSVAIQGSSISLQTTGNVGISSTAAVSVASGTTASAQAFVTLKVIAGGSAWLTDGLANDPVLLNASSAATEFSLVTSGVLGIGGNLTVSGPGSRIDLLSSGAMSVFTGKTITAASTTAGGGLIQIGSSSGNSPLTVINNGAITASNTSGTSVIGFNSGPGITETITGTGSITADQSNFGNLDPTTLQITPPFVVLASSGTSPFSGQFTLGSISLQQAAIAGSGIWAINVSAPPPPPTPKPALISDPSNSAITALIEQAIEQQAHTAQQTSSLGLAGRVPTDATQQQTIQYVAYQQAGPANPIVVAEPGGHNEAVISGQVSFGANTIATLVSNGIKVGPATSSNFLQLQQGNILIAPHNNTTVQTQECNVYIKAGAAVYVIETGHDVAVYNVHDSHSGDVQVVVGRKLITLLPGKQLVLTRKGSANFDQINPGAKIAYRNEKPYGVIDDVTVYKADFSITSALSNIVLLSQMLHSNNADQRKLAHHMLKMAAISHMMAPRSQPFHKGKNIS